MALARRFEDLQVWQEARRLGNEVYALAETPAFNRKYSLADQMRRAALSTMNNIAEGFDSASPLEFSRFLRYAARSASEVQSSLYLCVDQRFLTETEFRRLYDSAERVRRMCRALMRRILARRRLTHGRETIGEADTNWGDDWAPQVLGAQRTAHQRTRTRAHASTR